MMDREGNGGRAEKEMGERGGRRGEREGGEGGEGGEDVLGGRFFCVLGGGRG